MNNNNNKKFKRFLSTDGTSRTTDQRFHDFTTTTETGLKRSTATIEILNSIFLKFLGVAHF